MSVVLDILIVGTAAATGCGAGWWMRGGAHLDGNGDKDESASAAQQAELNALRLQVLQANEQSAKALEEVTAAKAELIAVKTEASNYRLEAAKAKRDLEVARHEADEAHKALSELQAVAARMSADVDRHNNEMLEINSELKGGVDSQAISETVAKLIAANEKMQQELSSAEERLKAKERELEAQIAEARTDALTGLFNRRAFDAEMAKLEVTYRNQGRPSSVMMIDVDHFKKFNDTYGHQAGDEVLRGVARVLRENLSGNTVVCRYGGEEFAVIFPGCGLAVARPAAERARAVVADSVFEFEGTELRVTASGGIAEFTPGETVESVVKRADDALYACKEAGRNCGHWHDGENSHPMTERLLPKEPAEAPASQEVAEPSTAHSPTRDPDTGLSTRVAFMEDLERRLSEWRRGGPEVSVILVEVDKFDRLTKAFGEKAGKTMLRATAQFLKATMRDMDHVARFDERQFALLLPGATVQDAEGVASRLRVAIENCKLPVNGGVLQFTISTGATEVVMNDTGTSLLERVNRFLQMAVRQGGNCGVSMDEPEQIAATN